MWRPILDGSVGAKTLAVVESIATAIRKNGRGSIKSNTPRKVGDASLANGTAGLAIFFAYLDQACPGLGHDETSFDFLDQAMEAVSTVPMGASLYVGITGVGWSTAHLQGRLSEAGANDATEEVDSILIEHVSRRPWQSDYDLVSGLVGFGVYALEQLQNRSAVELLAKVVDQLEEIAERTPDGMSWFTPRRLLPEWQRKFCPHGYYNTGMAHGVAGVIAFLTCVGAYDSQNSATLARIRKKAVALLDDAASWLFAQKRADIAPSVFPDWIGRGFTPAPGRVAWCYGDLGIAVALLLAGRCRANAVWKREALRLAKSCADRTLEDSGVKDCGLCHGSAGIAHLFNRMFQLSGKALLKKAAQTWFQRTLEMRDPAHGIGGYPAYRPDGWANEMGILEGSAGIALALLAGGTSLEPAWDRMLLASSGNKLLTRNKANPKTRSATD